MIEQYIRQAAIQRGIDPDIAVRVAKSEGGLKDPTLQSYSTKNGRREPSYGPFQLLVGGGDTGFPVGMGNAALKAGIDPRDPNQWQRGVDFALDQAKSGGWTPWYGAKAAGLDRWAGIRGGAQPSSTPNPVGRLGGDSLVARDHSAEVAAQTNTPLFGSLSPSGSAPKDNGIDPMVAEYANSDGGNSFADRLKAAGKAFQAAPDPSMPRPPAFPGGPTKEQAQALLTLMKNPSALAQSFLSRRMG